MVLVTKKKSSDDIKTIVMLNLIILILPVILAIVYPHIGPLAGVLGSIGGFLCIYGLPVITFLSQKWMEVKHPALMEALR